MVAMFSPFKLHAKPDRSRGRWADDDKLQNVISGTAYNNASRLFEPWGALRSICKCPLEIERCSDA